VPTLPHHVQRLAATLGTTVHALLKPVLERTQPAMEKRRLFPLRQARSAQEYVSCVCTVTRMLSIAAT